MAKRYVAKRDEKHDKVNVFDRESGEFYDVPPPTKRMAIDICIALNKNGVRDRAKPKKKRINKKKNIQACIDCGEELEHDNYCLNCDDYKEGVLTTNTDSFIIDAWLNQ